MPKFNRPLKIALDVWDTGSPEPRGVVIHFRLYAKACAHLAEMGEISLAYTGTSADREWLSKAGLLENCSFRNFRIPGRLQRGAAQLGFLPWGMLVGTPDIIHSSTLYPFRSGYLPIVGTLVDFVPVRLPEFVPIQFLKDQVSWCSWASKHPKARWISNSDHTKRDASALARLKDDQVVPVNLCADDDMFAQPAAEDVAKTLGSLKIVEPFLLCVNTLNLRKNHLRLLEAWEMGGFSEQGWTLVLVGHAAGHPSAGQLQNGEHKSVVWLGYLPREQLVHLFYGCEAVLNPSLYEGFGLSIAEAIAAGKPVPVSQRSPMAEIARDGAVTVDPWDIQSILQGLTLMIKDAEMRRQLAAYNWSQRDYFSIRRMAADLLRAYYYFLRG